MKLRTFFLWASVLMLAAVDEPFVMHQIQDLLQKGTMPNMPFNQWCDAYLPTLRASQSAPVKNLGQLLYNLHTKNMRDIKVFQVFPTLQKAVQVYDPNFQIKTWRKPILMAQGTYWYFRKK